MKQIFEIDWSGEQLSPEFIQLTLEMRFIEKQMNIHCGAFLNVKEITSFKDYGYCTCTVSGPCICGGRGCCNASDAPEFKRMSNTTLDSYLKRVKEEKERAESAEKDYTEMLSKVTPDEDRNGLVPRYGGIGDKIERYWLHKTAIIDNTIIGKNTKIWHWTHISDGVSIGKNCIIGQSVFVGKGVKIGNGCKIQNNVFIPTGVELEDNVFIGPSVVFTNVINPRAFIERKDKFKSTLVMLGTSIGANATILCGISIGKYAMIGAGAVVTNTVHDFEVVLGNPARVVGHISSDGSTILPKEGSAIRYF